MSFTCGHRPGGGTYCVECRPDLRGSVFPMAPPAERGAFEEALNSYLRAEHEFSNQCALDGMDNGGPLKTRAQSARAAVIAAKDAEVARERERIACYVESMMTPYTGTVDTGAIQRNGAALAIAAAQPTRDVQHQDTGGYAPVPQPKCQSCGDQGVVCVGNNLEGQEYDPCPDCCPQPTSEAEVEAAYLAAAIRGQHD